MKRRFGDWSLSLSSDKKPSLLIQIDRTDQYFRRHSRIIERERERDTLELVLSIVKRTAVAILVTLMVSYFMSVLFTAQEVEFFFSCTERLLGPALPSVECLSGCLTPRAKVTGV
jgi:hypothetical protein